MCFNPLTFQSTSPSTIYRMGSSGAGKTTLMDVLSLRKASGEVTGDIRVNGHPQESNSFRRMTGYVEQFDTQSPQLTIRETVEFSAKMRLDESIPVETKLKFVDHVLKMIELDKIANFLVGDDTGGLSFEQKKRLSIAVELASNPSCIFLDEPTSGLDARLVTFTHIWNLLTYQILSYKLNISFYIPTILPELQALS